MFGSQSAPLQIFQFETCLPPSAVAAFVQHNFAVACVCQTFVDKCDCNICHTPHRSCLVAVYCLKAISATYFCCAAQCTASCGLCGCAAASTAAGLGGVEACVAARTSKSTAACFTHLYTKHTKQPKVWVGRVGGRFTAENQTISHSAVCETVLRSCYGNL